MPCGAGPIEVRLTLAPVREAIAVSGTRSEAPVSQLGASVTVFDASDLERRQSPAVADLLTASPGVTIARTGGYGSVTSLFVRGGESNYNKVLIDGIPVNEPGGYFNFSNITSENLERVEIVRGAQSALFGSDAMASVIQLVTRRGRAGSAPRVDAAIEGGTYGTGRARAGIAGGSGRADYSAAAAWFTTDNRTDNNQFENTTLSATAGVQLGAARLDSRRGARRARQGRRSRRDGVRPRRHRRVLPAPRRGRRRHVSAGSRMPASAHRATYALSVSHQASTNLEEDPPYTPQFGASVSPFEFFDFTVRQPHGFAQALRHVSSRLAAGHRRGASAITR